MKKLILYFAAGLLALSLAVTAVMVYAAGAPARDLGLKQGSVNDEGKYLVLSEEGKLTVYADDAQVSKITTDIDTARLRQYDRDLLEAGIDVEGYEKMIGLLEDFSN